MMSMERKAGSSSKRDFLAEYEAEQWRAHSDTAAIGAKRPRIVRNEEEDFEAFGKYLTNAVGEQVHFLAAVDVHVSKDGLSYAKEQSNPRVVLRALDLIVCTYHLVGYFQKSPVYKAALSDDIIFEVYLFYYDGAGERGWYISTKWFYTPAQKRQAEEAAFIKAYSPGVNKKNLLELGKKLKVWMPYWQKQPFPGLFIQSTLDHKTEVLHALQEDLDSKDDIINDALQEVSEGHQQKGHGKNRTGKGPKPRHPAGVANGWMERAAILIQLLKDEEFEKAKEKAEYFELSFPAMQLALDRMQRNS